MIWPFIIPTFLFFASMQINALAFHAFIVSSFRCAHSTTILIEATLFFFFHGILQVFASFIIVLFVFTSQIPTPFWS